MQFLADSGRVSLPAPHIYLSAGVSWACAQGGELQLQLVSQVVLVRQQKHCFVLFAEQIAGQIAVCISSACLKGDRAVGVQAIAMEAQGVEWTERTRQAPLKILNSRAKGG
jgi:hypothetical protein